MYFNFVIIIEDTRYHIFYSYILEVSRNLPEWSCQDLGWDIVFRDPRLFFAPRLYSFCEAVAIATYFDWAHYWEFSQILLMWSAEKSKLYNESILTMFVKFFIYMLAMLQISPKSIVDKNSVLV